MLLDSPSSFSKEETLITCRQLLMHSISSSSERYAPIVDTLDCKSLSRSKQSYKSIAEEIRGSRAANTHKGETQERKREKCQELVEDQERVEDQVYASGGGQSVPLHH